MQKFHPDLRPKPRKWDGRKLPSAARVERKYDGWRATAVCDSNVSLSLFDSRGLCLLSSTGSEALRKLFVHLPNDTWVDGELLAPAGEPASRVTHYLAHDPSKLEFQAFAVPFFAGEDLRYCNDWDKIDERIRDCRFEDIARFPVHGRTYDELSEQAARCGIEGYVIKEHPYGNWWKVKPQATVDLVVMGTKPGVGKHKGRLGALICGALGERSPDQFYIVEVASVGKGNDDEWRDLGSRQVIGRVCEVAHEGVQAKGKLKFSSFVRWRADKDTDDATKVLDLQNGRSA